ncbi:MAG: N-carbamoyl-L-amino-acid hydrolase AmaB [Bacteroidetes bacterium HLUCCA01]|nr:MAG: N-carbamoyl-L-amino-acid hydrolase AmaB [Bacteroidetes bacterium HLUCCA01]
MLAVNSDRLRSRMNAMAEIGALPNGGVRRLALTDEDKRGRELFLSWCRQAGLDVTIDQMGSVFARKKATVATYGPQPVVLTGSHLDSQPSGGRFDGVLGVLAALEVVEVIIENNISHRNDIEIVSWTNEEGARFAPAMVASGVYGGAFSLDYALDRTDAMGISIRDELKRIGFDGDRPAQFDPQHPVKAYIELHIEQGPVLEQSEALIGVVTGVQGIRWFDVSIRGRETHAGPTPMALRNDPVLALGRLIPRLYAMAADYGDEARLTIGMLTAQPGSRNTVPGMVQFSVDIRHPLTDSLQAMHQQVMQLCRGDGIHCREIWSSPPVHFDRTCVNAVEMAAKQWGYPAQTIVSGAGHDAVYVSRVAPTAMIFIPCKDGISHNEAEYASDDQVTAGANVLLTTLLNLSEADYG